VADRGDIKLEERGTKESLADSELLMGGRL